MLIGQDILDGHKQLVHNVKSELCTSSGWSMPITRDQGHLFVKWCQPSEMFTTAELQRLHLHFFYPKSQRLYRMLRRALPGEVNKETMRTLEDIAEACRDCKKHFSRPYPFRVSLPPDKIVFKEEVAIDLFWICSINTPQRRGVYALARRRPCRGREDGENTQLTRQGSGPW